MDTTTTSDTNVTDERTLAEWGRSIGLTRRQAEYAAEKSGVPETRRVGIVRMYSRSAFERILAARTAPATLTKGDIASDLREEFPQLQLTGNDIHTILRQVKCRPVARNGDEHQFSTRDFHRIRLFVAGVASGLVKK